VRFIFSHSALREGWDNPNVFVICALKHSDNTISRRQEVGRGLRLSVNQHGDRVDHPAIVHDVNVLTVVASESYKDFVAALQKDISDSLSARPKVANEAYFTGKVLKTPTGDVEVTPQLAKQIYKYLLKNDYTDDKRPHHRHVPRGQEGRHPGPLPPELQPHAEQVYQLIDSVFSDSQLPEIGDDRAPRRTRSTQLRQAGVQGAVEPHQSQGGLQRRLRFSRAGEKAVAELDKSLRVTPLQYTIQRGEQADQVTYDGIKEAKRSSSRPRKPSNNRIGSLGSQVRPDRQAGRRHATDPPHDGRHPEGHQRRGVRAVQDQPRELHRRSHR
jgi:type III restriction enzyme